VSTTTEHQLIFPSREWFQALQELVNANPEFRRLGSIDTTMGVKVGPQMFLIVFRAFRCEEVRAGSEDDLLAADFSLEMSEALWQEMLENIKAHGGADLSHTLNTLDLRTPGGIASNAAGDQYRADLFFRYNQSLQHFFDLSSRLETVFRLQTTD
jgi:hypothetical protein